ncbi:MAG TPA: DCC1-like thiol-disulfide oxidoreductase family protein, partial [Methylomicrobium sp.]|nr:DCC1-like thiol-disulfide oxidoreductase family protein [Methylomicrobium sp.]
MPNILAGRFGILGLLTTTQDIEMAASDQSSTTASTPKVTCFHDGECPICNIEIYAMKKLDKEGNINWVDISRDKAALA